MNQQSLKRQFTGLYEEYAFIIVFISSIFCSNSLFVHDWTNFLGYGIPFEISSIYEQEETIGSLAVEVLWKSIIYFF